MAMGRVPRDGDRLPVAQSVVGSPELDGVLAGDDLDVLRLVWVDVFVRVVQQEALVLQFDTSCLGVGCRVDRGFEPDGFAVRVRPPFRDPERFRVPETPTVGVCGLLIRRERLSSPPTLSSDRRRADTCACDRSGPMDTRRTQLDAACTEIQLHRINR